MKYQNIIIKSVGTYHPKNRYDNNYFIEHFKKLNMEVDDLMDYLGRETHYFADENETVLTMAWEASKAALDKANLRPEQLDMIVFVTDTPEYASPCNALKMNKILKARNAHAVYDVNSSCTGMLTALDQVSRHMKSSKTIKYALIIGGFLISPLLCKDDPIAYPNLADCSAAVVLETIEEKTQRGFIDSGYFTDSFYHDTIVMPGCGYSQIHNENIPEKQKKMNWTPFNFDFLSDNWAKLIRSLLVRNNLAPSDVDHFIFSQFSRPDSVKTLEILNVNPKNFTYVGNKYGYTGLTSPIVALKEAIDEGLVKEGSNVVFCSVGGGYTMCSLLYKF